MMGYDVHSVTCLHWWSLVGFVNSGVSVGQPRFVNGFGLYPSSTEPADETLERMAPFAGSGRREASRLCDPPDAFRSAAFGMRL